MAERRVWRTGLGRDMYQKARMKRVLRIDAALNIGNDCADKGRLPCACISAPRPCLSKCDRVGKIRLTEREVPATICTKRASGPRVFTQFPSSVDARFELETASRNLILRVRARRRDHDTADRIESSTTAAVHAWRGKTTERPYRVRSSKGGKGRTIRGRTASASKIYS
jgi:hypothetical protein